VPLSPPHETRRKAAADAAATGATRNFIVGIPLYGGVLRRITNGIRHFIGISRIKVVRWDFTHIFCGKFLWEA
jgi:hypothetical protein